MISGFTDVIITKTFVDVNAGIIPNAVYTGKTASTCGLVETFIDILAFISTEFVNTFETSFTNVFFALVDVDAFKCTLSVLTSESRLTRTDAMNITFVNIDAGIGTFIVQTCKSNQTRHLETFVHIETLV